MITTATQWHVQGISELWQQSFGDNAEYVDLLLSQRDTLQNTLVYLHDGMVCGMLFMLPCSLVYGTSRYRCAYIYAIATHPLHRGQGISTQLIQHAHSLCNSQGYAVSALAPATPSLFEFYANRGYSTQGYTKSLVISAASLSDVPHSAILSPIDCDAVFNLRQSFFGAGYLEWDSGTLATMQAENSYLGGSFYRYELDGECGYIGCVPYGNILLIKEYVGSDATLPYIIKSLHRIYGKQDYHIRLGLVSVLGEQTPLAMTKWFDKGTDKPFYLSYIFD